MSTDSTGIANSDKKMSGGNTLLFGSFGTLNYKEKLLNSDQKIKAFQQKS